MKPLCYLAVAGAVLVVVPSAEALTWQEFARHMGFGHSAGYHARPACGVYPMGQPALPPPHGGPAPHTAPPSPPIAPPPHAVPADEIIPLPPPPDTVRRLPSTNRFMHRK